MAIALGSPGADSVRKPVHRKVCFDSCLPTPFDTSASNVNAAKCSIRVFRISGSVKTVRQLFAGTPVAVRATFLQPKVSSATSPCC